MQKPTLFTHISRPETTQASPVNPDIRRASTLLFARSEDIYRTDQRSYGRHGSPVHDQLKNAFNTLEGGIDTTLTPSGLSACTLAILAHCKAGDHILISDSCYGPTRKFCKTFLVKYGIQSTFYDPHIGARIEAEICPDTRLIFLESPGSLSMEIQDIPAIVQVAKAHNIPTLIDNTWAAGLALQPLEMGCDIVIHSATKFFCGHSDILFGAIISRNETHATNIRDAAHALGYATSPDDAYQILRGFRSLCQRFEYQKNNALALAQWLSGHNKVARVLHPELPEHPDHAIWTRDYKTASCLFSIELKPCPPKKVHKFINQLNLFGIGFSFGGYESLVIYCDPQMVREHDGKRQAPLLRFACGLEHITDLKNDIEQAFNVID